MRKFTLVFCLLIILQVCFSQELYPLYIDLKLNENIEHEYFYADDHPWSVNTLPEQITSAVIITLGYLGSKSVGVHTYFQSYKSLSIVILYDSETGAKSAYDNFSSRSELALTFINESRKENTQYTFVDFKVSPPKRTFPLDCVEPDPDPSSAGNNLFICGKGCPVPCSYKAECTSSSDCIKVNVCKGDELDPKVPKTCQSSASILQLNVLVVVVLAVLCGSFFF